LKIGQYLTKLKRIQNKMCHFFAPPCRLTLNSFSFVFSFRTSRLAHCAHDRLTVVNRIRTSRADGAVRCRVARGEWTDGSSIWHRFLDGQSIDRWRTQRREGGGVERSGGRSEWLDELVRWREDVERVRSGEPSVTGARDWDEHE